MFSRERFDIIKILRTQAGGPVRHIGVCTMDAAKHQTFEYPQVAVLIPAYEPNEYLLDTAKDLLAVAPIVVVDDGSSPSCAAYFDQLEALGVCVCHHDRNRGKGAALKTGIRYIAEHLPDCAGIVTADADGQHAPADIRRVAERTVQAGDALVLGVRDLNQAHVPKNSSLGNRITSKVFRLITRIDCPDTQTGLRGIPAALFPLALAAEGDRYEYEMNFLLDAAGQKFKFDMLPIQTIYLDDNRASHFRVVRDSFLIYRRPFTFLLGALLSTLVDLTAFSLLLRFLFHGDRSHVFLASVLARVLSGCVNFVFNKRLTFRSEGNSLRESLRYLCLFLVVMLVSSKGAALLSWLPLPMVLIKAVVDTLLFVGNYFIERKWVFRKG